LNILLSQAVAVVVLVMVEVVVQADTELGHYL
jgi:hypothetical protein